MTTKRKKKPAELFGRHILIAGLDRPNFPGVSLECSCGSTSFAVLTFSIDEDLHIQCTKCATTWSFDVQAFLNKTQMFAV